MNPAAPSPWIAFARPNPSPRLRLFCFPYAGGSAAMFRDWAPDLPPWVQLYPVQLPGRGTRIAEPPCTRLDVLVRTLARALRPWLVPPYALFGHSVGALVAFELARQLRREGQPPPVRLLVAGRRAPRLADPEDPVHGLPDEELIDRLRGMQGTPRDVLEHRELMAIVLPMLRADFALCETYVYTREAPLAYGISVFGGADDGDLPEDALAAWAGETTGSFRLRILPGDHFFLQSARQAFLSAFSTDLEEIAGAGA